MPVADPIDHAARCWAFWAWGTVEKMLAAGVAFDLSFTPGDMDPRAVADALLPLLTDRATISTCGETLRIQGPC